MLNKVTTPYSNPRKGIQGKPNLAKKGVKLNDNKRTLSSMVGDVEAATNVSQFYDDSIADGSFDFEEHMVQLNPSKYTPGGYKYLP